MAKLTATFDIEDKMSRKLRGLSRSLRHFGSTAEEAESALERLGNVRATPTLSVIDTATGTIRTIQGNMEELDRYTASPTIEVVERISQTLDQVERRLNDIDNSTATPIINAIDRITQTLDQIDRRLSDLDGSTASPRVDVDDQATPIIDGIQGKLDALKGTTLAIAAAGGITGASALEKGISSMEQNARSSAVTGIAVSDVRNIINDIYYNQKSGNSREEVSISFKNMAQQTDLRGNALKTASEISNKIAMIHEKDVPEVDRSLSSMIKNFQIDSTRAGDNLAYVFKHAGDQYEDLLDTFNEYSSSFVDMKLLPEQVGAAFVAGTKGGARNFDDMADSIREFNLRRREMSDDQVAAFKEVLGTKEMKKMFKGFEDGSYSGQEAMYRLANGLAKFKNENERAAIATTLIGTKYEDMKQPILDMAAAIDKPIKATGELNKQFDDIRNNNPMTPISDAGRNVQKIMSDIGNVVITNVAPAFEKLNKWLNSKEGQQQIEEMKKAISDFANAFGAVIVPAIQYGIEHFEVIAPIVGAATIAITGLGVAVFGIIPAINKFRDAVDFIKGLGGRGRNQDIPPISGDDDQRDEDSSNSRSERRRRERRGSGGLRTVGKIAGKALIPLGVGLAAIDIATSTGDDRKNAIGSAAGGLGGAAAGAAIGSVVPGVGTVIGGIVGGLGGAILGGKIADTIDLNAIQQKLTSFKGAVATTLFSGDWWSSKWNGALGWAEGKWGNITEQWSVFKEAIGNTLFNAEWWAGRIGYAVGWAEGKWTGVMESWNGFKETVGNTIFNGEWWASKWNGAVAWAGEKWTGVVETWNSFKDTVGNTIFNGEWWSEKWNGAIAWGSDKWGNIVESWNSFTTALGDTVFNSEWWSTKWTETTEWGKGVWEGATDTWNSFVEAMGNSLFNKEWWTSKWESAISWGQGKWAKVKEWFDGVSGSFNEGREAGKSAATGGNTKIQKHAKGGIITRPHLGLVGEAGPEAIIPLSSSRRGRALDLYAQTGQALGVRPYADGGIVGGSVSVPDSASATASLNVNAISVQGTDKEAEMYGQQFVASVAQGINSNVVSLDAWKKNNIQTPMNSVAQEAVGFGSNTVRSFSAGQNATPTNTGSYLNNQVKQPFQVLQGGASQWGAGTITGFRSGQNATQIGTRPYLVANVHQPFDETKGKGQSWGLGTAGEFVTGMRSQGPQVREAAKYLAQQVEKTFKEELGIHSPSRVMMKNGMWTAMGIVKGLDSVDIKGFAENQAGSLAAAFSGMGAVGGNVSEWIRAAMMITGVPESWYGPLVTKAMKESTGNPRAINLWDSNAKRGTPSKGLMQTIDPTFNAHKMKGMNDIWNPIHNTVAAIRYIQSRYGTIFNTPGIKSMARGGGYKGYAKGGIINRHHIAQVGEGNKKEVVIPLEQYRNRALNLLGYAQQELGVSPTASTQVILPEEEVQTVKSVMSRSTQAVNQGIRDIILEFSGENHYSNEMDAQKVGEIAVNAVKKALEEEYFESGEAIIDG
ncbi:phage tail tape measure protein [Metabacillus fastidiosus]|uniref:phage tail tape measure protein n=1 Tax=Metabacillus fastidiosus TaxID=1458 RepID=UPI003D2A2059